MKIVKMEVGSLGTNCYIVYGESSRKAAVIDPGGDANRILAVINRENLQVDCIINTHGHVDHIAANEKIKETTGAPLFIHHNDADMLTSGQRNLSAYMGAGITCGPADKLLKDKDVIEVGDIIFEVLHTPGHTPGGICLKTGNTVFSGDTLFAESIGRTDFPGGSYRQLIQSIREKLMVLPDDIKVYPGHGPETTIGWERKMNPFIQ